MEIVLTVRELLDKGAWEAVCTLKGMNPWAINEGLVEDTEKISLTEEEARSLYLIAREGGNPCQIPRSS